MMNFRWCWSGGIAALGVLTSAWAGSFPLTFSTTHCEVACGLADRSVSAEFSFENKTGQPVELVSAKATCGCTEVSATPGVYPPGGRGKIGVVFHFGHRVGRQLQVIQLSTRPESSEPLVLLLGVDIPEPVKFQPRFVYWTLDEIAAPKTLRVQINPRAPFRVVRFESSQAALTVKAEPVAGKEGAYLLTVQPKSTQTELSATISLVGETSQKETVAYAAYALVRKF